MRRFFCLASLAFLLSSPLAPAGGTDLDLVKKRMRESVAETAVPGPLAKWARTLRPDGTWSDIEYADSSRSFWKTAEHLQRTLALASACITQPGATPADPAVCAAAIKAFDHWLAKDYRNPNWWHNEIGVPRNVARILLALDGQLTPEQSEKAMGILSRSAIRQTGQNRVWQSGIVLMRAALQGDADLARQARDAIAGEIVITTKEGVQPDFSFHQHGPQQQMGNYGLGFASDISSWAGILQGSDLAFSDAQMEILRNYMLRGEAQILWNGMLDVNACGRQLFPNSQARKAETLLHLFQAMPKADPPHAAEYEAVVAEATGKRPAAARNVHFWRSDMMVHRRPGFDVSIKLCSRRVIGTECVNDENLKGHYLADGAAYVYRTGREYENIFAVWDWRKIPGITCAQAPGPMPATGTPRLESDFDGGVSDGTVGAAVLDYRRDGVTGKKSWFCFDDQVVCLGAGLSCASDAPLATSVNQCLLRGPVTLDGEKNVTGHRAIAHLRWAHHDGVGYLFPRPAAATLDAGPQTGTWKEVYKAGAPEPVTTDVFSLGVDHGVKPGKADYAYLLVPNVTVEQVQALAAKPTVEILSNTAELQAVRHPGQKLTLAIFHQPGQIPCQNGTLLAVDHPCALIVRETAGGPAVTVSDPTQKLQAITVTLGGKSSKIVLPEGPLAGSSITKERL
ncbi:MAG: polysaccharide lyase 8 family protein [Chthoniobacteraceae bacterium]|nr:polysaccharide lyase 8 family protein [Chthoniobacteraceae bacterium]